MKITKRQIIAIVAITVFVVCGTLLIWNLIEDGKLKKNVEGAYDNAVQVQEEYNPIVEAQKPQDTLQTPNQNTEQVVETNPIKEVKRLNEIVGADKYGSVTGTIEVPSCNLKASLMFGINEENMKNNACISEFSFADSLVVLGHNYRNGTMFHNLLNAKIGDEVIINYTDGTETKYTIQERQHLTGEEYNSDYDILFESTHDLILVTCEPINFDEGRCIFYCDKQ